MHHAVNTADCAVCNVHGKRLTYIWCTTKIMKKNGKKTSPSVYWEYAFLCKVVRHVSNFMIVAAMGITSVACWPS